jgi:hypothetical protein
MLDLITGLLAAFDATAVGHGLEAYVRGGADTLFGLGLEAYTRIRG